MTRVYKVLNHLFDDITHSFDGPQWLHIGQNSPPNFPEDISNAAITDLKVYYIPLALGIYAIGLVGESDKGVYRKDRSLPLSARLDVRICPSRKVAETFRSIQW